MTLTSINTLNLFEGVFHTPHTGRAGHAANGNGYFPLIAACGIDKGFIPQIPHLILQSIDIGYIFVIFHLGFFRCKVHRG
ncbi:MAG: hypothetical protein MZV70_26260 [Desulfobacterales bacterium]|nr:hypothetical protein [Desulfobacterales bacterium]